MGQGGGGWGGGEAIGFPVPFLQSSSTNISFTYRPVCGGGGEKRKGGRWGKERETLRERERMREETGVRGERSRWRDVKEGEAEEED